MTAGRHLDLLRWRQVQPSLRDQELAVVINNYARRFGSIVAIDPKFDQAI